VTIAVGRPVPQALGDAEVLDAAGTAYRLHTMWSARDVVLIFVRHFACAGCAEHVAALRPRLDELALLEADVTVVGCGSREQLAAFVDREDLARPHVTCFTDPTRAAYRAAGLVRSAWGTFGPVAIAQLGRALLHGHRNGRPQGDVQQMGGTLYVTRGGVIALYHRATSLGDHARLVEVVDIALAQRAAEAAAR
jgi:peroxiredoxin